MFAVYRSAQIAGLPNNYVAVGLLATTALGVLAAYRSNSLIEWMYRKRILAESLSGNILRREASVSVNDVSIINLAISDLIDSAKTKQIFGSRFDYTKTPIRIYQSASEKDVNAFACGWSKDDSSIYVSSEIIRRMGSNSKELKAVLAHEMGHIAGRHIMIKTFASALHAIVHAMKDVARAVMTSSKAEDTKTKNANNTKNDDAPSSRLPAFLSWVSLYIIDALLLSTVSRQLEYDADSVAVKCGLGRDLVTALNIIDGKRAWAPKEFLCETFSSHPTTLNRALAIEFAMQNKDRPWSLQYCKDYVKNSIGEWTSAFTEKRSVTNIASGLGRA